MNGNDISPITTVVWSRDAEKYNAAIKENYCDTPPLSKLEPIDTDLSEFDANLQATLFLPDKYKTIDIVDHINQLTPDDPIYKNRVDKEISLYRKYELIDILRICLYIADTAKSHRMVLGVGRGSSVASYVLYLLGIHKIDSVKYNLDMREFLK